MDKAIIISELVELLNLPSKTGNASGLRAVEAFIKKQLHGLPLEWQEVAAKDNAPLLIARSTKQGKGPRILLSGHIDTIYEPGPDFPTSEEGDVVKGSGAQDMKGGIVIMLETVKQLQALEKLQNVTLVISPEEETGTLHYFNHLLQLAKEADYAFVFESTLDTTLERQANKRSVVNSRKGIYQFAIEIKGPGGHSGVLTQKQERISSILKAAEVILLLESIADYEKGTTLNPGIIKGGDAVNVLAPYCRIDCDVRYLDLAEIKRVQAAIKKVVAEINTDPRVQAEFIEIQLYPSLYESTVNQKFISVLDDTAKELNLELVHEKRGGASEASLLQSGNPKLAVLDGFGGHGGQQHTRQEFVFKDSIFSGIDLVRECILKLQS